jgi:hypothetical protein
MLTRLRSKQRAVKEIHQIVGVDICFQDNVSSPSSVSAIGAAFRHKLLPAETDTTVATISRSCVDFYAINKHQLGFLTEGESNNFSHARLL